MDYKRIYDDLMQSRLLLKEDRIKLRRGGDYFEAHHIIPKSMGGEGTTKTLKHPNIVLLTGREHYIAHALLFLVYRNREMTAAFNIMCIVNKKKDYKPSARMYEFLRVEIKLLGVSDKTRQKIGQASLGRKHSPEAKERIRQASLSRKHSPEAKEKMRQANLGKKLSPEHIEKIRQINSSKKISPEHIEKMRQANLGRKHTPEHISKVLATKRMKKELGLTKPRVVSLETREKMSQVRLGKKQSPEHIKKRKEARKRNRLLKLAQLNGDDSQGGKKINNSHGECSNEGFPSPIFWGR